MSTAIRSKKSPAKALHRSVRAGGAKATTPTAKIGRDRKVVRQLPLTKLAPLAARLAATADDKEAESLRKQFLEGYYGKRVGRSNAQTTAV